eukprot:scaffold2765_cov271-Chaetoceros_neogracile.AAC.18
MRKRKREGASLSARTLQHLVNMQGHCALKEGGEMFSRNDAYYKDQKNIDVGWEQTLGLEEGQVKAWIAKDMVKCNL